jgi:hypothetical protein
MMDDFEQSIDRELKQLPAPRAPGTLLPRVLTAVADAETAPWYSRAWITWPREFQVFSAVLLVLIVAGLWWLVPSGQQWIVDVASPTVTRAYVRVAEATGRAAQLTTVVRVVWQVLLQPIALTFLALMVAVSLMCAALWAAVNRLALGGASPQ